MITKQDDVSGQLKPFWFQYILPAVYSPGASPDQPGTFDPVNADNPLPVALGSGAPVLVSLDTSSPLPVEFDTSVPLPVSLPAGPLPVTLPAGPLGVTVDNPDPLLVGTETPLQVTAPSALPVTAPSPLAVTAPVALPVTAPSPLSVTPSTAGDVASALTSGRKTVTTPATAVALASSTPCRWVTITALKTNTDRVNVGGSGVLATLGASTGEPLDAGESVTYPIDNANKVFVDARVSGEGVSYTIGS